jgi:hypothetical protein
VAIFSFEDQTGSRDFAYMSDSISDAINESMQKNFSYDRVNPDEAKTSLQKAKDKVQQESAKTKFKDKEEELLKIYKIMAKEIKADIIIYGFFTFNSKEQKLEIKTRMFYVSSQEFADIPDISNKIDSTIFGATDKTAQNIISEIRKMTETVSTPEETKTASAAEKKPDSTAGKPADTGKITLTKKLAKKFARFIDNYNGTISDNKTGLVWQKCVTDKSGKRCTSEISREKLAVNAKLKCEQLTIGNKKWSLPTKDELLSIVNPRASRPAIHILFAPYTDYKKIYLTATKNSEYRTIGVSFEDGSEQEVISSYKYNSLDPTSMYLNYRCVARASDNLP